MGQTLTVQVLNSKEFDSLPYENISDSWGIADTKKGLAFVRNSGSKEFDLGTIAHEVNHLIEKHGKEHPDWESGVLHKKGGFFRSIAAPVLGGLATLVGGPGLGALVGGLANTGFNTYAQSQHPEQLGAPSVGGSLLQAGTGALAGYGAGQALTGGIAGGTQAAPGLLSKVGGALSGAVVGTPAVAGTPSTGGLLGSGGKFLGIGAPPSGTALTTTPGTDLSSQVAAFGGGIKPYVPPSAGTIGSLPSTTPLSLLGVGTDLAKQVSAFGGGTKPYTPPSSETIANLPSTTPLSLLGNGSQIPTPTPTPTTPTEPAAQQAVKQVVEGTGASGTTPVTPLTKDPGFFNKLLEGLKTGVNLVQVVGGTGLLGASAAIPEPEFQMPDSFFDLQNAIQATQQGTAVTPLGQQALLNLSNILQSTPGQTNPALVADDPYFASTFQTIDNNYIAAKNQLDAVYNLYGQLGSGGYLDQVRQLTEATANVKNQYVAQENTRRSEIDQQQQFQAIQLALGVDDNTMQELAGLTGMDVQVAAMKYGASVADIEELRKQLGTLGTSVVQEGLGIETSPTINLLET